MIRIVRCPYCGCRTATDKDRDDVKTCGFCGKLHVFEAPDESVDPWFVPRDKVRQ